MYLSKLEIFGFKSFANRTVVNFNKGVTSIVGPNGCGKTNIVDAIRWSLGEQKSSTLRSDKMENVIFNGTQNKKPMGMAEVSLTLVNDNGVLPTEYSEVTITRRIFRSGESEYLLNRNICRLKDITNLFMDTGMGTNAYSVIELKMVETILSNKADERRNMFEEAAGVNKYKLRRRLALKKLEEVKKDLTRVNDIVAEVEKQVASLERQAKKADKYNKISSVLREQELDLAEREYALWNSKRSTLKEQKEEAFRRKVQIESELRKLEDELVVFRNDINLIENDLKIKRRDISAQTDKIHNVQNGISVAEERKKSLDKNLTRYGQELEELHFQDEDTDDLIFENSNKIVQVKNSIEAKEKGIEENKQQLQDKKQVVEDKKAELRAQREENLNKFKDITEKEHQLKNLRKNLDNTESAIEKLNNKILSITNTLAKTVGYLEELEQEKVEAEKKLAQGEEHFAKKQTEKEELEKELTDLKGKEHEERSTLNSLKDKIDFLQSLINNLEGVSKGAKVLIENEGWTEREKTFLADVGNAEEDYRFALEASLKNVLNNLLVESFQDLQKAVDYLRENNFGKASFYVLGYNSGTKKTLIKKLQDYSTRKNIKKLEKEGAFIGWAENFIQADEKWKPFFKKLLYMTAITKDLESAFELSRKFPEFNFATLNGDFLNNSGLIDAGSAPRLDDTLFGRKQMLENLKNEFPTYEANLLRLRDKIKETEAKVEEIDLKDLSDQNRILINDLANIEKQIAQFEFEKKKASDEIEKARFEINELARTSNQIDNEISSLSLVLEEEAAQKKLAEEQTSQLEEEVKASETAYNSVITQQNQMKLELERLLGEKKNLENSTERAQTSKENIKKSIQKREFDITSTKEEMVSLDGVIEDKQLDLDEFEAEKKKMVAVETEIDNNLRGIKSQAMELEKKLLEFRKERDRVSDEIHSADIKINEITLKIDNLFANIKENYSITLELKEFDDLDTFNFQERSSEVQQHKQQLKGLGPINLLAYSEYEEERERLDFLHKQRNDLVESEKDLIKTIEEINVTAQTLFLDTFATIRENFIRIFRTLFNPGDEADLKLEEDVDPLESKIEIIAKPKGKRPTGIELLSGGEKTLTATALLFSIYLVKPSPFCILDEVDAPLDDANVDRFTRIIKEFSKSTQFIIVTHNKRTMEAAETMYGVTIQEEGISKLVSVRFNEDFDAIINR
ncbi:MAG: chromosome segregation protein SMC [Bacteroidota bacterium]|nr:chromosome segregation protein SMC [Ignavibacteria bacterium]MCU7498615.1 chromosome segregation protein SMC [Ignavibacteria bacterium]MCU7512481.1 chromosome segregation protein SMC [Ignavibacteria bacterium]MCU7520922.1 chromosome segregation protein SMC [Ignavibacteria bacterium]MCU7523600.1 chromosome segregation protein SMC [Ignavibacteria bacterium]